MNWLKKANQKISYTAIILDNQSHNILLEKLKPFIPDGWKIYAHHMTINLGPSKDKEILGKNFSLMATEWAKDDKVIAVGVDGFTLKDGRKPHVTVAVNTEGGGKPKDSNQLQNWQPISNPIALTGTAKEVPMN